MGPHALVFFLRSCTKVMKVTAAAVDELLGISAYDYRGSVNTKKCENTREKCPPPS